MRPEDEDVKMETGEGDQNTNSSRGKFSYKEAAIGEQQSFNNDEAMAGIEDRDILDDDLVEEATYET